MNPDYQRKHSGTASGTNTYTVTFSPSVPALLVGSVYNVTFTNANTGASTLNGTAIQYKGAALTGGEIPANATMPLKFDGAALQIVGVVDAGGAFNPWPAIAQRGDDGDPGAPGANSWPQRPAQRFIIPLMAGNQSTTTDATQKRTVGQLSFDPTLSGWGTSVSSTITLKVLLQTTNSGNTANCDLNREPSTSCAAVSTSGLTATLLTADVSAYFNNSATAGIFDLRIWNTTNNGNDVTTITSAELEVQP